MESSPGYQIKSTPFMRRMISTNTKNGELQRLKQEYDKIKSFNERNIEVRMRQARLKRLYRVIEMIKDNDPLRVRTKQKTEVQRRAEQINKARELGQEFSRQNAVSIDHQRSYTPRTPEQFKFSFEIHDAEQEEQRRERSYRRLDYGNTRSRINRDQLMHAAVKRISTSDIPDLDTMEEKRKRLLQRIKYGNSCSHFNMTQLQRLKNQLRDQNNYISHMRWLDSINRATVMEAAPQTQSHAVENEPEQMLTLGNVTAEEHVCATPRRCEEESITNVQKFSSLDRTEASDLTLKPIPIQNSETRSNVRGLVLKIFKSSYVDVLPTCSSYKTSEFVGKDESAEQASNHLEHVILEDVEEDGNSTLHYVNNTTNLQDLYTTTNDLNTSTSAFVLPSSSNDEALTPDELVLSCQRYIDHISEDGGCEEERSSKNLNTYAKMLDFCPNNTNKTDDDGMNMPHFKNIFEY